MRYLITGGAGYIGSRLVLHLSGLEETEEIIVADVREPREDRPKTTFRRLDVRDRQGAKELLAAERPDCLVHLAFLVRPLHDEATMYGIDVNGTQNVLEAASHAGTQHVLATSSTTAYGAFPDNPVPLTEDDPVRGTPDFSYARDKAEADRLCQLWALQHPDRTMTIVRPCIVFGEQVDNYILNLWLKSPFRADFGLPDPPMQFLHDDDLCDALIRLVEKQLPGAYNVAGDGYVTVAEAAEMIGLRSWPVPYGIHKRFAALLWDTHVTEVPPGQYEFIIHPWVASNQKLKDATGWTPRYTSRETFELTMRAKGRVVAA